MSFVADLEPKSLWKHFDRILTIPRGSKNEAAMRDYVIEVAERNGYWDPEGGRPFRFWEAYDPEGRMSFSSTRREWRVLDMLAPSLKLDPGLNDYPFSVKPDRPVGPKRIMEILRDTFEGTDFDMVKNLTVTDESGKPIVKPAEHEWVAEVPMEEGLKLSDALRDLLMWLLCLIALLVLALLFLGGEVIRPFAVAMAIGIVIGTYSSVFIAAPTLLWLESRFGGQEVGGEAGPAKPAKQPKAASAPSKAGKKRRGKRAKARA